ncbi:MAG: DbpA RNA binding domain-containing protein, partial [Moheibacter sp.]
RGKDRSRNYTRFFISIGQKQKLKAPNLIGLINEVTKTRDIKIGDIEILRNFSFFEADSEFEELILKSFKNEEVEVQISNPVGRKQKEDFGSEERSDRKEKRHRGKSGFGNKKFGRSNSNRGKTSGYGKATGYGSKRKRGRK